MAAIGDDDDFGNQGSYGGSKKSNILPFWGNEETMNLNPLILTNVQNSPYYKLTLVPIQV
jgi:pre-mRNA-splicing factor 38B